MTRHTPNRRGYLLMAVLLFNVLFAMLLGMVWRQTASVLRIASIHSVQSERDEGSLRVLADAMRLLETGLPPASPYIRGAVVTLETSGEARFFSVRFEQDATRLPDQEWSVTVTRVDEQPQVLLPTHFPTANP